MTLYIGQKKTSNDQELRDGFGLQLFPNGSFYVGEWLDDKAHGKGQLVLKDGTFYEGVYQRNCIVNGRLYYFNGAIFEGTFDGSPFD